MKRTLTKILSLALILALTIPMTCLWTDAATAYGRGNTALIYQGAPSVDGVIDESWKAVDKHVITMDNNGQTQAQRISDSWFKVMYDANTTKLYFLVHAIDSFVLPESINAEINQAASWANDLVGIGVAFARPVEGIGSNAQFADGFEMIDLYNNHRRGYGWVTSSISKTETSNNDAYSSMTVEYNMEIAIDLATLATKQGQQMGDELYFDVYLVDTGYFNGTQWGWTPGSVSGNGNYKRAQTYTWNANSWNVSSGCYNYYGTATIASQGVLNVGAQTAAASNAGSFTKLRLVAKILGEDYTDAGFKITASDTNHVLTTEEQDLKCTVAYKSVLADGVTQEAEDGYYLIVITIDNVPTDLAGMQLDFTPYAVGTNGTVYEGVTYRFSAETQNVAIAG